MKKQIFIAVAIFFLSYVQAQDIAQEQVPADIMSNFNKQFTNVSQLGWELEGELYKADFETGWKIDHEVWYNAGGEMVRHKEDISVKELPETVASRIKSDFNEYTIDDLERITSDQDVLFKMELNSLIHQDWDIVIDINGNIISKFAD